jgi:acyl-CoA synthetase (NDP forming)
VSDLESFFNPKGIAVIGASGTSGRPGYTVIENMVANGYSGPICPVNPRGGEILGYRVYRSIIELPDGIDMGIVLLPASAAPQVLKDCASKGIKTVVLAAGGFAEVDLEGQNLQIELERIIENTGIRVLGPNTAGHISTSANFTSSFFPLGKIPEGTVSFVAQTGNFTGAMMRSIISGEHYGVARCVGLGNAIDIDECDILEYLAQDPETKTVLMYLESLARPKKFLSLAKAVTREKPLIILKGGSTDAGARAAQSHTASLSSNDNVLDGAFAQAGVVRLNEFSELFLASKAAAFMPVPKGPRVGFVSPSGAFIVHISDMCKRHTILKFPEPSSKTYNRLKDISPPFIRVSNPTDVFPSATVYGMEFAWREAMRALLQDPRVDSLVTILILAEELGPMSLEFIPELAAEFPDKPIYVSYSGDENSNRVATNFLEPLGIPTFPRIEDPFKALNIMAKARLSLK